MKNTHKHDYSSQYLSFLIQDETQQLFAAISSKRGRARWLRLKLSADRGVWGKHGGRL
jgi:hypothetical protein